MKFEPKYITFYFRDISKGQLSHEGTPIHTYMDEDGVRWWHIGDLAGLLGYDEDCEAARAEASSFDTPDRVNVGTFMFPDQYVDASYYATRDVGALSLTVFSRNKNKSAVQTWLRAHIWRKQ